MTDEVPNPTPNVTKELSDYISDELTRFYSQISNLVKSCEDEIEIDFNNHIHEYFRYIIISYVVKAGLIPLPELYYNNKHGCYVDVVAVSNDRKVAYAFEIDTNLNIKSAKKLIEVNKILRKRNILREDGEYCSYAILICKPGAIANKIEKLYRRDSKVIKFLTKNDIKFLYISSIPFSALTTPQLISFFVGKSAK